MRMPPTPADIANRWIAAFNRHDLDGLLALYANDAVHRSPKLRAARPETNGLVHGKDALRGWWRDAFERLPTLQYKLERITADKDSAFIIYERNVAGEPVLLVAECFVIRDGLICQSNVFHG
jgi:ketosteroid isomerase-like protein